MRRGSLGILSGLGLAALITVFVAADPPASLLRNESTTNSPAKFPPALPTTTSLSSTVIKLPGTDGTVSMSDILKLNDTVAKLAGGLYYPTSGITANTLYSFVPAQYTNCTANPTFSSIAGVTNGLFFQGSVLILANGADRTCSFTTANVHNYPSGTYVATNGSAAQYSWWGIGGIWTNGIFLPFP